MSGGSLSSSRMLSVLKCIIAWFIYPKTMQEGLLVKFLVVRVRLDTLLAKGYSKSSQSLILLLHYVLVTPIFYRGEDWVAKRISLPIILMTNKIR